MQFVIDIGLIFLYCAAAVLLCGWTWKFWYMYVNQQYLNKLAHDMILLEFKLPREIMKSPLAAEVALASLLYTSGVTTWYGRNIEGKLPATASLEIASIEGVIHFYVRIDKKFQSIIEASFYSQYPGIEIVPADDYTKLIRFHHLCKDVYTVGTSYVLKESWTPHDEKTGAPFLRGKDTYSMPADFLPMKTYVDYGLDKDPKEEYKTDPMTFMLEAMGSCGKDEHFWYQIIVQAEGVYNGKKFNKFYLNEMTHEHWSLKDMADRYKKQLRILGFKAKGSIVKDQDGNVKTRSAGVDADGKPILVDVTYGEDKTEYKDEMKLSQDEKEKIEAVNKKLSKHLVNAVIRSVYTAKKEVFNKGQISNITALGRPYKGDHNFLAFNYITDPYDYKWEDIGGRRSWWRAEEMFEDYVERAGHHPHIPGGGGPQKRESLDKWEDYAFWTSTMKKRKFFRLVYEGIFHPFDHPHPDKVSTYNLEELASLWHFPGAVAGTPTLPRIDSVKGVAPTNLPM